MVHVYIYATTICEVHASCVHVLLGVSIAHDQFYVGQPAIAACRSVTPATRIEWLRNGEVVASIASTSIQELNQMFSVANDSIHNQVYVCRVTRDSVTVSQNFTVQVNGKLFMHSDFSFTSIFSLVPSNAIQVSIERSGIATAGEMYSLACNVSAISGFVNPPSVAWTVGGRAINTTNGSGITLSNLTGALFALSTLIFDPLRTSHSDVYTCGGSIASAALETPQTTDMQVRITVQSK